MSYEEDYKNKEYCLKEIGEARKLFTNKNIKLNQWDNIQKMLGLMYLYCPSDIQGLVLSQIEEMTRREPFMRFNYNELKA